MDNQTIFVIVFITIAIAFLLWRGYIALKRYSCCGTCGCDLMTKKERKAFEDRKDNLAQTVKEKN